MNKREVRSLHKSIHFDWSKLPKGYKYLCMNPDGVWAAYRFRPIKGKSRWYNRAIIFGKTYIALDYLSKDSFPTGKWENSLLIKPLPRNDIEKINSSEGIISNLKLGDYDSL